jgi:hypothetical protein
LGQDQAGTDEVGVEKLSKAAPEFPEEGHDLQRGAP